MFKSHFARGRVALMVASSALALTSGVASAQAQASSAQASSAQANPSQASAEVEEVVIVGYRAQNAQAVAAKRLDDRIADYLAADDIGSQPDYNISDAIRRMPGIQTVFDEDEGKFVSIRGLNPSYTLGALDGATIATSERQNRQLNLEAIPSGAIRQVAATKARTPDVDGNAIGGTIDLRTRSAFDAKGLYMAGTLETGFSTDTDVPGEGYGRDHDDNPNYKIDFTFSNRFGQNDQLGVLIGLNYFERNRDQKRLLPQIVPAGISATPTPVSTLGSTDLLWSTYPNTIKRYGGIAKLEWRPNAALEAGASMIAYKQDDNELRHSQRLRNGTGSNASFVRFNDFPLEKPTVVGRLFTTWRPTDKQRLDLSASYSEAQFLEPSNQIQFNLGGAAANFDLSLVAGGVPVATNLDPRLLVASNYQLQNNTYARYRDDSDEYVREFRADYGFNTQPGDEGWGFGAGAKRREITRNNDRTDWSWRYNGAQLTLDQFLLDAKHKPVYGNFNQFFIDFQKFEDFFKSNAAGFTGGENASVASDWNFEEKVSALYGLARYATPRYTVIVGGRFESTDTEVERNQANGAVNTRVTREGSYDNFLPSATLSYRVNDQLRVRASAYKALGRPDPFQLASGETVNQTTGAINRGNPNLKAREGASYEAALEYYMPGDAGVLSIGVFRKDIDNEIVTRLTPKAGPNGEDVTQPINVTSAEVTGVELNAIVNRLPLPGLLSNLGMSANASFIDGSFDTGGARGKSDRLQGQAKTLVNLALFYEQGPFRARAAYAYTGDVITSVSATDPTGAADRVDKPTNTVDLQTRYRLNSHFELIGEVRNATNENKVNYTGTNIYRDVSFYGRQVWFGLTFKY